MHESFPYSIALCWKGVTSDSSDKAVENQQMTVIFPKGNQIPSIKAITFLRHNTFSIDVVYVDKEHKSQETISTYMVIIVIIVST